jgi:hypothetical protein
MAENIILTKLSNVNTTLATEKEVKNNMHKVALCSLKGLSLTGERFH